MPIYKKPYIESRKDREIALGSYTLDELIKMGGQPTSKRNYILTDESRPNRRWYEKNWARRIDLVFERRGARWRVTNECYRALFGRDRKMSRRDLEGGIIQRMEEHYFYQGQERERRARGIPPPATNQNG